MAVVDDRRGPVELDEAIDALYTGEPGVFVAERTRLVAELRAAKRRDDARQVAALRRPTVTAWALNRVTATTPGSIDALVDAGGQLRQAQQRMIRSGGEARALHQARAARREVIGHLVKDVVALLRERGGDPVARRDEIEATLEAISLDPGIEALARLGRLTTAVERPSGLEGLLDAPDAPDDGDAHPREPEPTAPATPSGDELEQRRDKVRRERRARAEEEAGRLERLATDAQADADQARSRAEAAAAALRRLEGTLAEARDRATITDEAAQQAGRRADAARRAADDARARLGDAD